MLLWFPLLLHVYVCLQSTQGHANVCNVLYCSLSVVCESQTYPGIPSQWIHTHSHSLLHTHRHAHNQSQPARECETPQYLSVSRNLAEALGSSQRRSVWDQRPVKKIHPSEYNTHTHIRSASEKWRSVRQGCRGGFVWFGCLPLSDERCHFSSYFMKDEGRGGAIGQRACKVKGCQADVRSHLPSLFLHLVCFLHSPSLSRFIISPNLFSLSSFLFHFGVWRHHRPLPAGTGSESIQGYISYY